MAIAANLRRDRPQALSNGHTMAQTPSHFDSGGYESDVEDEDDVNSDEDDDPLITPSNLDEPNPFTNQQEQYLNSGHGSSEDLDKVRTTNASLLPRIVRLVFLGAIVLHSDPTVQQSTLRTPSSQTDLGYVSSNSSENEDQDLRRQKLLQVPIRVYVQIQIVTSEEDDETNP